MGWSLRKSFKVGPARINLSSRGVGYSVGVRGLRVGSRAGGRGYVSGGRGMLRFQSSLGPSSTPSAAGSPAISAGFGIGCLVVVGFFVLLASVGWVSKMLATASEGQLTTLVGGVVVVAATIAWAVLVSRKKARAKREAEEAKQKALEDYLSTARALVANQKPLETDARRVLSLRRAITEAPEDLMDEFKAAYRDTVADAVADQQVTPEEQGRLSLLARGLGLPLGMVKEANRAGFLEGVLAMIKDCKLTEAEEVKIEQMRAAFGVDPAEVAAQLTKVDQLKRARVIDETEELLPIEAGLKFKKGEVCYYKTSVTELKDRTVRTWVENGEKQTERALEAERSGDLYVTSERLLFVAEGTTSIKSDSLMRIHVEPKPGAASEAVALTVDGRKTPYYFDASEPFVLLAYILHVAKRRRKDGATG